jgi:hypothetical protein
VELSASLAAGLQLPAPTLQQQPAASQAVAEFLEAISSMGSPSVLVGVDLVRPAGDMMGPPPGSSSSSSGEAVIAIGSISGLGDVTQSLRIASAMQRQCPELFIRGTAFTGAHSACVALLAEAYLPALAGQDSTSAAAAANNTAGLSPAPGTNSTASNSTADSSNTLGSFAVRVVMPVAVNIKLSVAVRAGSGHNAEALDAAAHTWLASQDFQQLLEDQGLQTGRGTPARLVAVMPQPGSSSSNAGGDDDADDDDDVSGGGGAYDKGYNKESGWFIPWKPGHGSSSGALPGPQAGLPQKPPGTAGRTASEDPHGWVELSHQQQHDDGNKKQQSLAVIVGGLLAATVLGAGTAVAVVAVVRRRRMRREKQGKGGGSKSSSSSDGSSRGGSSAERRARRVSVGMWSGSSRSILVSAACWLRCAAEAAYFCSALMLMFALQLRYILLTCSVYTVLPAVHTEQPWHWQALPQVPAIKPHSQQLGSCGATTAGRSGQWQQHGSDVCSAGCSSSF